jgi:biopolymer transport protein ExbD
VNSVRTAFKGVTDFADVLRKASGGQDDPTIIINADAKAPHQSVISIMEAARIAGFGRITFTTQNQQNK